MSDARRDEVTDPHWVPGPEETPGEKAPSARADARRNRARLLDAARTAFREQGAAFQIEEVADRAGIGVGTVYRNFANKDDLIEAIVLADLADDLEKYGAIDPALSPWDGFCAFVHILAHSAMETSTSAPIVYALGATGAVRAEIERFYDIFAVHVDRAQAAGELRADVTMYDIAELVVRTVSPRLEPIAWKPLSPNLTDRLIAVVLDGLHRPEHPGGDSATS
jgi:AcrR family transcriptional regulator